MSSEWYEIFVNVIIALDNGIRHLLKIFEKLFYLGKILGQPTNYMPFLSVKIRKEIILLALKALKIMSKFKWISFI